MANENEMNMNTNETENGQPQVKPEVMKKENVFVRGWKKFKGFVTSPKTKKILEGAAVGAMIAGAACLGYQVGSRRDDDKATDVFQPECDDHLSITMNNEAAPVEEAVVNTIESVVDEPVEVVEA